MTATVAPRQESDASGPVTVPADRSASLPGCIAWVLRGRRDDPAWVRSVLLILLIGSALLYFLGLAASGYGNDFYAAAAQAGGHSGEAFFFGSSDWANAISVDKPPLALWVIDLSVRLFGLGSWSVLAPQALEGVASVGLLYLSVRRVFSARAALVAGALFATTPVVVLMFRFDNPDSLLVLLLIGAAYASLRAMEEGRTGWIVLAGALVGAGFLTKMLQALLVLPACGGVYGLCAPGSLRRRCLQLLAAAVALVATAGWWVLAVQVTPAGSRPYVGSSSDNSVVNLVFGYNGIGRLSGREAGSVAFDGSASGGAGSAGFWRLLNPDMRMGIAWFLPAAILGLGLGLWWTRRRSRTDLTRAFLLVWGGILVVTAASFSIGQGIIHPYYTVALAPFVAALAAVGAELCWERRKTAAGRRGITVLLVLTLGWSSWCLFGRPPWQSAAGLLVVLVALTLAVRIVRGAARGSARKVAVALALIVCSLGSLTEALVTAASVHHGAVPEVGYTTGSSSREAGSLTEASHPGPMMISILRRGSDYSWAAATIGSERAAGYQLAIGRPVMAIGGFNGTDPLPSLAAFRADIAKHRVHYFIDGGPLVAHEPDHLGTDASAVRGWVETRYPAMTIGGVRIYDLAGGSE